MWQTIRYGYHAGQKNYWCKFKKIVTFMEVKDQMGSNIVSIASSL